MMGKQAMQTSPLRRMMLVWLVLCSLVYLSAAQTNVFGRDAVLVVKVGKRDPSCPSSAPCLQPLYLQPVEAPWAAEGQQISLPRVQNGAQQPCTLPPDTTGLGQISLSGDGKLATLVCYAHPPGTALSAATKRTIAVIQWDGSVDTSTLFETTASDLPFSAVTDDGTRAWVGSSLGLGVVTVGSSSSSSPPLIYSSSFVRHVSLVNGSDLFITARDEVLRFPPDASSSSLVPPATAAQVASNPPSRVFAALGAYGHSVPMLPRGGRLLDNDRLDVFWSNSSTQTPVPASATKPFLLYAAHPVNMTVDGSAFSLPYFYAATGSSFPPLLRGYNLQLFEAAASSSPPWSSASPWTNQPYYTVETGIDILYVASQACRYYPNHRFDFRWAGNLASFPSLSTVMATGPRTLYNVTMVNGNLTRSDFQPVSNYYRLPPWERRDFRFLGVSFAPLNLAAAFPAPSAMPTPSPSRSPSASRTQTAAVSASSTPVSSATASPSLAFEEVRDFGIRVSEPLDAFAFPKRYLLFLRIGDVNMNVNNTSTTITASAYDFRDGAGVNPWLAQPLFVDKYDKLLKRVVQVIPLPSKRNPPHFACTNSIASHRLWRAKLTIDVNRKFAVIPCYDAEPGELVPDSYYPPPFFPQANLSLWKQPGRVIAALHGGGYVDTRTRVDVAKCNASTLQTAMRGDSVSKLKKEYYYVGLRPFLDAPADAYGRCGLRFVAHASSGLGNENRTSFSYDYSLTTEVNDDTTFLYFLGGELYGWWGKEGEQRLLLIGPDRKFSSGDVPDPAEPGSAVAPTYPPFTRLPMSVVSNLDFSGSAVYISTAFKVTAAIFVNPGDDSFVSAVDLVESTQVTRLYYERTALVAPKNREIIDAFCDSTTADNVFDVQGTSFNIDSVVRNVFMATVATGRERYRPEDRVPGSAIYEYAPTKMQWSTQPLVELPCCSAVYISVVENTLFNSGVPTPTPTASASPSMSSSHTPTASATRRPVVSGIGGPDGQGSGGAAPSAPANSGTLAAGIIVGVVLAVLLLIGCCTGAAWWRYRGLLKKRRDALLDMHEMEERRKAGLAKLDAADDDVDGGSSNDGGSADDADSDDGGGGDDDDDEDGAASAAAQAKKIAEQEEAKAAAIAKEAEERAKTLAAEAAAALAAKERLLMDKDAELKRVAKEAAEEALKKIGEEQREKLSSVVDEASGAKLGLSADRLTQALFIISASDVTTATTTPGVARSASSSSLGDAAEELSALLDDLIAEASDAYGPQGDGGEHGDAANSPDTTVSGERAADEGDISPLAIGPLAGGGDDDEGRVERIERTRADASGKSSSSSSRGWVGKVTLQSTSAKRTLSRGSTRGSGTAELLKAAVQELAPVLEPQVLKLVLATAMQTAKGAQFIDDEDGQGQGEAATEEGEELEPLVELAPIAEGGDDEDEDGEVVLLSSPEASPQLRAFGTPIGGRKAMRTSSSSSASSIGSAGTVQSLELGTKSAKRKMSSSAPAARMSSFGGDAPSGSGGARGSLLLSDAQASRQVLQSIVTAALRTATQFARDELQSLLAEEAETEAEAAASASASPTTIAASADASGTTVKTSRGAPPIRFSLMEPDAEDDRSSRRSSSSSGGGGAGCASLEGDTGGSGSGRQASDDDDADDDDDDYDQEEQDHMGDAAEGRKGRQGPEGRLASVRGKRRKGKKKPSAAAAAGAFPGPAPAPGPGPLSMKFLKGRPEHLLRLQQRVAAQSLEAGRLAALLAYKTKKRAVEAALADAEGKSRKAQEQADIAARVASAAADMAAARLRERKEAASKAAEKIAALKKRRGKGGGKGKGKGKGQDQKAKTGERAKGRGAGGVAVSAKAKPSLAELERKYGALSSSSSAATGNRVLPPPPGFGPFLRWFVKQQALRVLGPCLPASMGGGQKGAKGAADKNSIAAFAALGLNKDDATAFLAQNKLLEARMGQQPMATATTEEKDKESKTDGRIFVKPQQQHQSPAPAPAALSISNAPRKSFVGSNPISSPANPLLQAAAGAKQGRASLVSPLPPVSPSQAGHSAVASNNNGKRASFVGLQTYSGSAVAALLDGNNNSNNSSSSGAGGGGGSGVGASARPTTRVMRGSMMVALVSSHGNDNDHDDDDHENAATALPGGAEGKKGRERAARKSVAGGGGGGGGGARRPSSGLLMTTTTAGMSVQNPLAASNNSNDEKKEEEQAVKSPPRRLLGPEALEEALVDSQKVLRRQSRVAPSPNMAPILVSNAANNNNSSNIYNNPATASTARSSTVVASPLAISRRVSASASATPAMATALVVAASSPSGSDQQSRVNNNPLAAAADTVVSGSAASEEQRRPSSSSRRLSRKSQTSASSSSSSSSSFTVVLTPLQPAVLAPTATAAVVVAASRTTNEEKEDSWSSEEEDEPPKEGEQDRGARRASEKRHSSTLSPSSSSSSSSASQPLRAMPAPPPLLLPVSMATTTSNRSQVPAAAGAGAAVVESRGRFHVPAPAPPLPPPPAPPLPPPSRR